MSTGDSLGRRAIGPRHTVGVVVLIGALGILVAVIVWLVAPAPPSPGLLTDQQFAALRLGQSRSNIEQTVGPPRTNAKVVQPSSLPSGMTCTYYDGTSSSTVPTYFRLCYTNDVLSSKVEYSSVYGPYDQPSLTPSPL